MLDPFKKGEKLSHTKLNVYRDQVLANRSFETGVSSPQGHAGGKGRDRNAPIVDNPYPYEVIQHPSEPLRVAIRAGAWDVYGHADGFFSMPITDNTEFIYDSDADLWLGQNDLTTSSESWVHLLVIGAGDDDGDIGRAATVEARVAGTYPNEASLDYQQGSIKVLSNLSVSDSDILTINPHWVGGHLNLDADVVDSLDPIHATSLDGEVARSLGYDVFGRRGLYNFSTWLSGQVGYALVDANGNRQLTPAYACLAESSESARIEDVVTNMGISGTSLVYTDAEYRVGGFYGLNDGMANFLSIGAASLDLTPALDEWWTDAETDHTHPHEEHTFNTDDHVTEGVDRYIINDGDAERNNMSGVIGDNAGTPADSIRPNSRQLAPVGGVGWALDWAVGKLSANAGVAYTFDWINRKLGGGFWTVEDTTDAGVGTGSIVTLGGASVAKKFRVEDTTVAGDGTGAIVTLGGGYFANGVRAVGSGLQAGGWFNTATEQALLAFGGSAGTFAGTGSSVSLGVTATPGMAVNVLSGDYYHLGLQGVTGDGFSGGIKVDEEASDAHTVGIIELYL